MLSGSRANFTVRRLRRIITGLPAANSTTSRPSAESVASRCRSSTRTSTVDCWPTITARLESVCGQIGVIENTPASGATIAPPAASE